MSISYEAPRKEIQVASCQSLSESPHFHGDIEVVFMLKGQTMTSVNYSQHLLKEGELLIVFPNQVHFYNDLTPNIDASLLIFSPSVCPEFNAQLNEYLPENPIISFAKSPELYDFMMLIAKNDREKPRHHHAVIRALISAFVGTALQQLKLKERSNLDIETTGQIVKYCVDHFREDISLETISEALHISKYHISHIFTKEIKIGFNQFINTLRVNDACEKLVRGESITDSAFNSGFSSIRSFNRAFLNIRQMTPRQYVATYKEN